MCDPSVTRAIPERFRDKFLMINAIQIYGYLHYVIGDRIPLCRLGI